ncbi:hypothetical protein TSAR_011970 [Trichomalopsis sarcophagae]|uniref:Nucleolar protein 16 n=1 Tax=Trichomalopsis sarcophagae TaxID=543379 RepID=A0A232FI54_9HYME|nr:hypothetical protein TSAR_011970 [Trichomalopsis sarcophagae]
MPKIKKLKRRKKFRANVNRKRLRNKLEKLPNIECKPIKEAWEKKRSTVKNLAEMGLAYDPNQVLKIPNVKKEMLKFIKEGGDVDDSESETEVEEFVPKKLHVVQRLEEDAKHPRAKLFRLPNNEVNFATYMMDKYGDDYKAMVRDRKNYYQLTWRQIKAKIERFKSIPEQYAEYLVKKGEIVLDDPTPLKKIKPEILKETIEKKPDAKPSRRQRKQKQTSIIQSIWQEESIGADESMDISAKTSEDGKEIEPVTELTNSEKKLQLFSDDEDEKKNDNDNHEEDDDYSDIDVSDSENESDKKVEEIKVTKHKVPVMVGKHKKTNLKVKQLKGR